ncbi:hypothetical protein MetexDRAFT_6836 [Methylorubrum extorquens DSM 13060]|uniref:Uncharacterized protein n=1 Tax=Methylorubrum extorquens DSM 13060 TaxID=882800 RepID=H1KW23_METEX|nr:hypothetical protein MetexDRAFT_6836 [Methylorubrum extorquens DSM 13060]
MHMMHDPDEWMTVCTMTRHSASLSQVRRTSLRVFLSSRCQSR